MKPGHFNDLITLWEYCDELRDRLNETREALTDEQWDAATDGPFGEILMAAMDVESAFEDCLDS